MNTFTRTVRDAVKFFLRNGYSSREELERWQAIIRQAAERENGSVIQQILPTFYVNRLQQQFSKYFSSLQIALADVDPPVYNISAITNSGSKIVAQVYV
ncbi:hypothetical protein NEU65_003345 [Salmonella enterica]|nr:hypothetical protein [Salmonella enterica]